jgi:hypothetical protein
MINTWLITATASECSFTLAHGPRVRARAVITASTGGRSAKGRRPIVATITAWPSFRRAYETVRVVDLGGEALDKFLVECHGLIDEDDPIEPRPDVPMPTLEDVGALNVIVEHVKDELANMEQFLEQLVELRNAAAYLTLDRMARAEARNDA